MGEAIAKALSGITPKWFVRANPTGLDKINPVMADVRKQKFKVKKAPPPDPGTSGLSPDAQQAQLTFDGISARRRKFSTVFAGETGDATLGKAGRV